MEADRYLAAARAVIAKAETRREVIDAPCRNCKYRKRDWMGEEFDTCRHPIVQLAAANADDRGGAKYIVQCEEQRSKDSVWGPVVCGPNGVLFEAR